LLPEWEEGYKMELMYASLLLHATKQPISEENLKKILTAVGVQTDETKVKAVVAALEGINIEEVINKAAIPTATVVEKKEEEKKEEDAEKKAEQAAAGLSALFG